MGKKPVEKIRERFNEQPVPERYPPLPRYRYLRYVSATVCPSQSVFGTIHTMDSATAASDGLERDESADASVLMAFRFDRGTGTLPYTRRLWESQIAVGCILLLYFVKRILGYRRCFYCYYFL